MKKQTMGLAVLALLVAITIVGCKPQETNQAADILLNDNSNSNQPAATNSNDDDQNINRNANTNDNSGEATAEADQASVKEFTMTSFYEVVDGQHKPQFSLAEMTVKKGDKVRIKITNTKSGH